MEIDRDALVAQFFAEATDLFAALEEGVLALERRPDDREQLKSIFRSAHTLKGNASMVGLADLAELAHAFEELLDDMRQGRVAASAETASLLLATMDALRELLEDARRGGPARMTAAHRRALERLAAAASGGAAPVPAPDPNERSGQGVPEEEPAPDGAQRVRTIRTEIVRLDRMLNLLTELTVTRQRLSNLIESGQTSREELLDAFRADEALYADLQTELLSVRTVPLGPIFRGYRRSVRDLALANGKQARLEVRGGEVEVDVSLVEHLTDPLTHMIRNAIDHGIEAPDQRRERGKDPCGVIELEAEQRSGSIGITMRDDGAGLNRARILASARARSIEAPDSLSDDQVFQLVFEAGVSTAEAVTGLSGRGVGMDVVRRRIEALRGSVCIEARAGGGTQVSLQLPLTLAIIRGFVVGVADERYVIPLESVVECVPLPGNEPSERKHGVLELRGRPLPYLRLREVFGLGGSPGERGTVVVVEQEGKQAGLAVDLVLGEAQSVIKPVSKVFGRMAGVAGSSILGTGRVALILDVPGLMRAALRRAAAPAA